MSLQVEYIKTRYYSRTKYKQTVFILKKEKDIMFIVTNHIFELMVKRN